VRVGVERTLRYQRLYDPALFSTLTESDGRAVYAIGHLEEVRRIGVSLEFMAAVSLNYLRQLVGERVAMLEVWLEGQPRGPVSAYEAYFGGPVRFGRPSTALVLDPAHLDRPVIGADPQVLRYLGAYAEGLLAERPETERQLPLAERVRHAVERGVLEGNVETDAIARRLGMSTRTMQRHLAASGVGFQGLCDEVRRETAMRLLRGPGASIHEVAFALGYADVPTFYRAFKRWTGRTPAEVLRELRAS
jgi:AraC-like DNA-binding protein